ncbi:hypothetical protein QQP08_006136 [Theobroma cacao]|nr:hypothetical protein QQP08_006136 [Theobroma cacao]
MKAVHWMFKHTLTFFLTSLVWLLWQTVSAIIESYTIRCQVLANPLLLAEKVIREGYKLPSVQSRSSCYAPSLAAPNVLTLQGCKLLQSIRKVRNTWWQAASKFVVGKYHNRS